MLRLTKTKKIALVGIVILLIAITGTFAYVATSQSAFNATWDQNQNYGGRIHDHFSNPMRGAGDHNKNIFAENFGDNPLGVRVRLREFLSFAGEPVITETYVTDPMTWSIYHALADNVHERLAGTNAATIGSYGFNWLLGDDCDNPRKIFMPTFNHARFESATVEPTVPQPFNVVNAFLMSEASGQAVDAIATLGTDWERDDFVITGDNTTDPLARWNVGIQTAVGRNSGTANNGTFNFWALGEKVTGPRVQHTTNGNLTVVEATHRAQTTEAPACTIAGWTEQTEADFRGVMTLSQWNNLDQPLGNFWVFDDSNNEGWFYWNGFLAPGSTDASNATSMLLERIYIPDNLDDGWEYVIHIEADFFSTSALNDPLFAISTLARGIFERTTYNLTFQTSSTLVLERGSSQSAGNLTLTRSGLAIDEAAQEPDNFVLSLLSPPSNPNLAPLMIVNQPVANPTINWEIMPEVAGISVDNNGIVTVADSALLGVNVTRVIATSTTDEGIVSAYRNITITGETPVDGGILPVGMNVADTGYFFARQIVYNDIMRTRARLPGWSWGEGVNPPLREDGYPTEINGPGSAFAIMVNNMQAGEYVLKYDGQGEVSIYGAATITSQTPGRIYVTLSRPLGDQQQNADHGRDLRRVTIHESLASDPIRNIRLIPVQYADREHEMPLFYADFLDSLRPFHNIRFHGQINSTMLTNWQDRPVDNGWNIHATGLPFEHKIMIANELNTNLWLQIPHLATDDFMHQLAVLVRDNLNPNLQLYIEFSNEIWHNGFIQGQWIDELQFGQLTGAEPHVLAGALAAINDPTPRPYGAFSDREWGNRRHIAQAYLFARANLIFEDVFTGSNRNRLVTTAQFTHHWPTFFQESIDWWIANNAMPDAISAVGYFGNISSEAHARFMQNPSAVTADDIINWLFETTFDGQLFEEVRHIAEVINNSDARLIVYEGGQHTQPFEQGQHPYNQAVWDAQIHPLMFDLYMYNFQIHADLGADLFMNFSLVSDRQTQWGSWGSLEHLSDARLPLTDLRIVSPKWYAVIRANTLR